ncbi:MAG: hypothetical protein HY599_06480 [Candidatus Omnitrophica bacterium]|nr:hypothetical protein [Candidatus Omnitrophota bacterium]
MKPGAETTRVPYRWDWLPLAWRFLRTDQQLAHILHGGHLAYLNALWRDGAPLMVSGRHWPSPSVPLTDSRAIDNGYRPANAPGAGFERQPLVVGDVEAVREQFRDIAVQEWWHLVAPGGYVLLRLAGRSGFGGRAVPSAERALQLCAHGVVRFWKRLYLGRGELLLIQKQASVELGRAEEWSFGIISNGQRAGWLQEAIAAIREQGIPRYEIILVGPRDRLPAEGKDLRVIDFTQHDDRGWISRKKNLVAEHARYENLAILHDRIRLDPDWYTGMLAYGNAFWLLGVPIRSQAPQARTVDWVRFDGRRGLRRLAEIELLDYADWDPCVFINGALLMAKRSCWLQIGLDERLFWQEDEDVWFSRAFIARGWLPRLNVLAAAWSKTFYPTRVSLQLLPDGGRRRVVIPWSRFSRTPQPLPSGAAS